MGGRGSDRHVPHAGGAALRPLGFVRSLPRRWPRGPFGHRIGRGASAWEASDSCVRTWAFWRLLSRPLAALRVWVARACAVSLRHSFSSWQSMRLLRSAKADGFRPSSWCRSISWPSRLCRSGVAIGVQTIAGGMLALSLPLAKGATIFLVMTDLTLAAAAAEDASFRVDRSPTHGAEAFTDEAFERLPPGAAVLVRSSALALRLWSARLTNGIGPTC